MSTGQKFNEDDAYGMFRSLGAYLKTTIETSSGVIERKVRHGAERKIIEDEGHRIKVTVSNTAPAEPLWPSIVFTGIGLVAEFGHHPKSSVRAREGQEILRKMKKGERLKVDTTQAPQLNPFRREGAVRIDDKTFPHITDDEKKHGDYLFPGQSIVYELNVLSKECPDVKDVHLWVEGTLSRRHLFHFSKAE